jgi:hypothetical protein
VLSLVSAYTSSGELVDHQEFETVETPTIENDDDTEMALKNNETSPADAGLNAVAEVKVAAEASAFDSWGVSPSDKRKKEKKRSKQSL